MQERIRYFDILRIIAIEFVIWLHCMSGFIISTSIYGSRSWDAFIVINEIVRAGVPLFLMLSGYLALNSSLDMKTFYKKRFVRILIPLISWNVIYFVWSMFGGRESSFFVALFNEGQYYHMWFVYMLLGMYFVAPFLKIIINHISLKQVLLLFIIIIFPQTIIPFINAITGLNLYVAYPVFENYLGYFVLGYILGKFEIPIQYRMAIYAAGVLGAGFAIVGNCAASSVEGINLVYNGGYSFNHYLVAGAIFTFVKYLPITYSVRAKKCLRGWSDIIFGVYFIHVIILEILSNFLYLELSPIKIVAIYFCLTSIISTAIIAVLSRITFLRKLLI